MATSDAALLRPRAVGASVIGLPAMALEPVTDRGGRRRTKTIAPDEVEAFIAQRLAPGRSICIGGLFKQGRPMALVRALIRTGIGELRVFSSPGSGYDVDLLIAAGAVAETFLPAVTLEHRLCPNFRMGVEGGRITAHAVDALTIVGGLMAGAHGVPYQPVAALNGSDVIRRNPLIAETRSPFGDEALYAVRAIRPDLALLHAQEADEFGNIRHLATMTYADQLIARAAKSVIVSVDRLVKPDAITREPKLTSIAGIYVDAVIEMPFGAHPTASFPHYAMDEDFIDQFADLSDEVRQGRAAPDRLSGYLDRHVREPRDIFDYIDTVGGYRRLSALEREARFV